jgi:hypothetical protein
VLKSWEAADRLTPKNVKENSEWTNKWLYEIYSLDEKMALSSASPARRAQVTNTTTGCYNPNEVLEMSAPAKVRKQLGPVNTVDMDLVLIDTGGGGGATVI